MAAEISVPKGPGRASATARDEEVAAQLQRVYEYVLEGRRPEAVGATEELAAELAIDIERPA